MDTIKQMQREWRDAPPVEKMYKAFTYSAALLSVLDFILFIVVVGALGANWYIVFYFYYDMTVNIVGMLASRKVKILLAWLVLHTVTLLLLFSLEIYFIVAYFHYYFPSTTVILDMSVGSFTILLGVYYILYTIVSAPIMFFALTFIKSEKTKPEFDAINDHDDSYLSDN